MSLITIQCPRCPKNVQLHTWTVLLTYWVKILLKISCCEDGLSFFPLVAPLLTSKLLFLYPQSLSRLIMQRMGITGTNSYNQGHDERIWSNMITFYTGTLIQDNLQWTVSQIDKNKTSGKGNPSEECLFSCILWVLKQRKNNTLSGFAGVLPPTGELSLKIWPTVLCFLISFLCIMECLLCLSNTILLIV